MIIIKIQFFKTTLILDLKFSDYKTRTNTEGETITTPTPLIYPINPHRRNIVKHILHLVEREPAIKPFHHRRHVGKEPIGCPVLGLLEDGREDQAADLFLEERQAGDDEVSLGEMQILQDFIHPVGTVMDDGDTVSEFPLQQVHVSLFEFDEDDVGAGFATGDEFMGKGAVARTEFYDGLYFIPVDSGDNGPAGRLRTGDHRGIAEWVFEEVEQEEGALFPDIMVDHMGVCYGGNAHIYSDFCQVCREVLPHG